jgi:hypothetical protein
MSARLLSLLFLALSASYSILSLVTSTSLSVMFLTLSVRSSLFCAVSVGQFLYYSWLVGQSIVRFPEQSPPFLSFLSVSAKVNGFLSASLWRPVCHLFIFYPHIAYPSARRVVQYFWHHRGGRTSSCMSCSALVIVVISLYCWHTPLMSFCWLWPFCIHCFCLYFVGLVVFYYLKLRSRESWTPCIGVFFIVFVAGFSRLSQKFVALY